MTFVLVGGGLDLSVGSVLALGGVIAGLALLAGIPIWIGVLLGVLAGFSGVRDISSEAGAVLIHGLGGETLRVPCRVDFLAKG